MNLSDLIKLNNTPKAYGESMGFGEADAEEIPSGEMTEEGPAEEPADAGADEGYLEESYGDESYGDEYSEEGEEGEGQGLTDPYSDVEDSEKILVKNLRENMATFYNNREADLEKISSSNMVTSEYGDEINKVIENYKSSLQLYKDYLRDTFPNESTSRRVVSFLEYKALFNQMNKLLNNYFAKLGVEELSTEI